MGMPATPDKRAPPRPMSIDAPYSGASTVLTAAENT